jgi:hypothetical protein
MPTTAQKQAITVGCIDIMMGSRGDSYITWGAVFLAELKKLIPAGLNSNSFLSKQVKV